MYCCWRSAVLRSYSHTQTLNPLVHFHIHLYTYSRIMILTCWCYTFTVHPLSDPFMVVSSVTATSSVAAKRSSSEWHGEPCIGLSSNFLIHLPEVPKPAISFTRPPEHHKTATQWLCGCLKSSQRAIPDWRKHQQYASQSPHFAIGIVRPRSLASFVRQYADNVLFPTWWLRRNDECGRGGLLNDQRRQCLASNQAWPSRSAVVCLRFPPNVMLPKTEICASPTCPSRTASVLVDVCECSSPTIRHPCKLWTTTSTPSRI